MDQVGEQAWAGNVLFHAADNIGERAGAGELGGRASSQACPILECVVTAPRPWKRLGAHETDQRMSAKAARWP